MSAHNAPVGEGSEERYSADPVRPYCWPGPGKLDAEGVEWWACDPYPTWYRWEGGTLLGRSSDWDEDPDTFVRYGGPIAGGDGA